MRRYLPVQPPKLQKDVVDAHYRYREYLPSKCLASYVACYWTVDYAPSVKKKLHRIIPDGCVDIIIDRKSPSFSKAAFVAGLMTEFEAINLSQNVSLFGIRFFSDTASRFLHYPVSEFTGYHVLLEEIWGFEAALMVEQVVSAAGMTELVEKVEATLMDILHSQPPISDEWFRISMQYIYANRGMLSIRSLAEELNYSERHLRRIFKKEIGTNPKELLNIIRFQSLLQELYHGSQHRLTDLAVKYGYYDQSHFIRHFKRYYGLLPGQVIKSETGP
ncbi:DUF6597 domain-containing transcriptional factor [Camelliibacillus cellulosilyticus]|uniref:DUF6597 domain-containing transcriptional factor n=1 Tax=Camelliibacillus cellulosilyticus TaxID=2174486 RepID=A0ABV9GNE4_9BACL